MPRIALGVEYDGTEFIGWQLQKQGRSVQGVLMEAVGRVAAEPVHVRAAGRTDTGVHALQQVTHFDTSAERTPRQWVLGINSHLSQDVRVHWAKPIDAAFDARRSAIARHYCYRILEGPVQSALARRCAWHVRTPLDCAAMSGAAASLLGEQDFSAFRAAGCQSHSPWRLLSVVSIERRHPFVTLSFEANAFLYHMVRNLVGTLVDIGSHRTPVGRAAELLAGRDRRAAGATAPAAGLTLVDVTYPEHFAIPTGLTIAHLA